MNTSYQHLSKRWWISLSLSIIGIFGSFATLAQLWEIEETAKKIILFVSVGLFLTGVSYLFFIFWLFDKKIHSSLSEKISNIEEEKKQINSEFKALEAQYLQKENTLNEISAKLELEKEKIRTDAKAETDKELEEKKIFAFVQKAKCLVSILQERQLNNTFEKLFEAFSEIPSVFESFFSPEGSCFIPKNEHNEGYQLWDELNGITLQNYFLELNESRKSILLGNFRIYALCVSGITDLLMTEKLSTGVIVWTVLKKPLWRWYNMINIDDNYFASPVWWEQYLSNVKKLTNRNGKFQMNRLIVDEPTSHNGKNYYKNDLFVYKRALKFSEMGETEFKEVDLINYIKNQQPPMSEKCVVYPIAFNKTNNDWKSINNHFQSEFGPFINGNNRPLEHIAGVYNKVIKLNTTDKLTNWLNHYDDIFIVQFLDEPNHLPKGFGIAFQESKLNDDKGIVVFDQTKISKCIEALNEKW